MALAIVAAIIGALLNFSLPKLSTLITEEMMVSVDSIITQLKFIVAVIQDRSSGRRTSRVRSVSIEELRSLAFDLEDCIERFVRKSKSQGFVMRTLSGSKVNIKFAGEISRLKERSDLLLKLVKDWDVTAEGQTSAAQTPPVLGMGESLCKLRELMGSPVSESEGKLKVISVVGFSGGLGMSTVLAQQVYNDCKVREQFPLRAWVGAAGKNTQQVVNDILEQVLPENTSTEFEDKGEGVQIQGQLKNVQRLRSCLQNKRYLIVIDDIQTEDLSKIICAFPCADLVGGRIIVTTTIQSTLTRCVCGNDGNHVLDDGKKLFIKRYAPEGNDSSAVLLKKCEGLSPALLSISTGAHCVGEDGELVRGRFQDEYDTICAETRAKMRQVIESNCESLASHVLQDLWLYFCMFPRDHPVKTNPLKRRWLAEGLVSAEIVPEDVQYTSLEDVAAHNLHTLIDCNIIQPIQVSNSFEVKRCQPPVMMLDYIYHKSMTYNFITLFCGEDSKKTEPEYVRRLSLHPNSSGGADRLPQDLSRLRTLAVFPTADFASNYGATLNFAEYNLLRVLDLEECNGLNGRHLKNICNLLLLKYLSLGGNIVEVPREIANLRLLETLDLRRTEINTLPAQVIQLPSLMHLLGKFQLDKRDCNEGMMKNLKDYFLSNRSKLERLSGFVTGDSQGFPQLLCHMMSLKKVKIWCDFTEGKANLAHLSSAITGFVRGGNSSMPCRSLSIEFKECSTDDEQSFLDSLQAPGSLASLKLRGKLRTFPQFVTRLNTIHELCLSSTNLEGRIILAGAGNLPALKYLKLIEDSMNLSGHDIECGRFPRLLRICFSVQKRLELPRDIKEGAMELLVSLHLLCQDLVGSIEIKRLHRLKEVTLHPQVPDKTKHEWQKAAQDHSMLPNVLFIDPPRSRNQEQPLLTGRNGTASNRTYRISKIVKAGISLLATPTRRES